MSLLQPPVSSLLDMIGNTPMIQIRNIDTGPCRLFVKMESYNPGGSIKDRMARTMIEAAEKNGDLKPGGTIVEATAGNTGLGLAMLATLKGYRVILVVPDKMSREKIQHCKALGADVRITRSDVNKGHPDYYQDMAKRIAEKTGGYYMNQFENPHNPLAHETTTAPEIWEQMGGDVGAIVCGVGSGGTVTGIGNFITGKNLSTKIILADPEGSILAPLINEGRKIDPGSWLVEGIGEDFVPDILNLSYIHKAYTISDLESFQMARTLLLQEGILAGSSSGTLVSAAVRYCREQAIPQNVVTFICDRGDKYLSKAFSDPWMREQGLTGDPATVPQNVNDMLLRRHEKGETVFVRTEDTIMTAYKRMRLADVSQLPVLENEKLAGIVDEMAILHALEKNIDPHDQVSQIMDRAAPTVAPDTPVATAVRLIHRHPVLMIKDQDKLSGILTRLDFIHMMLMAQQQDEK